MNIDPGTRDTSIPGIYAAGDLTTRAQAAIIAAAAGMQAAAAINAELTADLVTTPTRRDDSQPEALATRCRIRSRRAC